MPPGFADLHLKGLRPGTHRGTLGVRARVPSGKALEATVPIVLAAGPAGTARLLVKWEIRPEAISLRLNGEACPTAPKARFRPRLPLEAAWGAVVGKGLLSEFPSGGKALREGGLPGALAWLRSFAAGQMVHLDYYSLWVQAHDTLTEGVRAAIREKIRSLSYKPTISVVLPVYNTDERWLRAALDSVLRQLYPHWELCVADDASSVPGVREILREYEARDPRVRVRYRERNGHISAASNSALELARGEFVALLDHDDELAEHALFVVADELSRHPEADILYSDEDKIDERGRRFMPHFKTQWSPYLLRSYNFMNHLSVYRTSLLRSIGGFREGFEGSQDYDLALRACEHTDPGRIRHLPHILYHWRVIPGSVTLAGNQKSYAFDAAQRAIRESLERQGLAGEVGPGYGGFHRVRHRKGALPPVQVIVPTRDRRELLEPCIRGLLEQTDYPDLRITIVDNGSRDKSTLDYLGRVSGDPRVEVRHRPGPFNFSALNNEAARATHAPLLAFLNNDTEVIHPDWLREMASLAVQKDVGAVGARLLYPDGSIQHGGVLLGLAGGVADHAHRFTPRRAPGYLARAQVIGEFSAVTAACLVMRREVFERVGGFDEKALAVAYNDVDLCLKVREAGYRVVWTPYAELYHKESASRGPESRASNLSRFERECRHMRSRWKKALEDDPFYNPNFTLEGPPFSLAFPPRRTPPWIAGK